MAKQSKPAAQKEGAIQTALVEDLGPIVFFFFHSCKELLRNKSTENIV